MNELKTWENLIEAFRLYREDIFTFIFYRSNNRKDIAEDITQETFEKAWLKKEFFKGGNLKGWLFQIALNKLKDNYKKWNKETELEENDFENLEAKLDSEILNYYVLKALEAMPVKEKDLIILHYILGYSYSEIAEILNKNENSTRVAVNRAFLKLKEFANGKIK